MYRFQCDYTEGAHPAIMQRMVETNMEQTDGYGLDPYCDSARQKIKDLCECQDADVHFLVGGTQTNTTVISAALRPYQGAVAAVSGHINVHETGAIEATGHKVLPLPSGDGKISAVQVDEMCHAHFTDGSQEHMVQPGMVYISHPTEYGTLYTLEELTELSNVCHENHIPLYMDGARLAYALACSENQLTLADIARLCDIFYIGGTKCGALFGEAVVIPKPGLIPHFFTIIKQHGALLAKGRLLGIQFDTLFTDSLYEKVGAPAIQAADQIRKTLKEQNFSLCFGSPTNQVFCIVDDTLMTRLEKQVEFGFWEKYDDTHTVIRFATSWATTKEDVDALCNLLCNL